MLDGDIEEVDEPAGDVIGILKKWGPGEKEIATIDEAQADDVFWHVVIIYDCILHVFVDFLVDEDAGFDVVKGAEFLAASEEGAVGTVEDDGFPDRSSVKEEETEQKGDGVADKNGEGVATFDGMLEVDIFCLEKFHTGKVFFDGADGLGILGGFRRWEEVERKAEPEDDEEQHLERAFVVTLEVQPFCGYVGNLKTWFEKVKFDMWQHSAVLRSSNWGVLPR